MTSLQTMRLLASQHGILVGDMMATAMRDAMSNGCDGEFRIKGIDSVTGVPRSVVIPRSEIVDFYKEH